MRDAPLVFFLALLLVVSIAGLVLFYSGDGFGAGRGFGSQIPRSFWLLVFVVPLVIALVVLGYRVALPEIKIEKPDQSLGKVEDTQSLDAVMRVLNEDEKKVIEVIASSEADAMLQKDIRWKTGLSRVKTHRVLARLAQRGIIKVEKYYNTNKIALADWLTKASQNKDA